MGDSLIEVHTNKIIYISGQSEFLSVVQSQTKRLNFHKTFQQTFAIRLGEPQADFT